MLKKHAQGSRGAAFDIGLVTQDNGEIYECLRTIAACYVRADMSSICDCITAYKLNEVLSKATRLKRMQYALFSDSAPADGGPGMCIWASGFILCAWLFP